MSLSVFCIQAWLLPDTGMTWDEPASWFVGRANLRFWQTGNRGYIDNLKNPELFVKEPIHYIYGEDLYPPFAFVIQSFFSETLAEKLSWLNIIDAHHLGEVFIASIGVGFFLLLALEIGLSLPISLITAILYATYPTIWGQMRSDAKDVPLMSLLVITVYLFLRWLRSWQDRQVLPRIGWGILFGASLGLTQATKITAVVIVPILGLWTLLSLLLVKKFRSQFQPLLGFISLIPFIGLVAVATFILAWPWLWPDVPERLGVVWRFFRDVGLWMPVSYFGRIYTSGVDLPWHYPLGILVVQTPVALLVLAAIGLIRLISPIRPILFLPVIWFLVGMGRFLLPGVYIYARVRHFIDVLPAFFLLVGIGIDKIKFLAGPAARFPRDSLQFDREMEVFSPYSESRSKVKIHRGGPQLASPASFSFIILLVLHQIYINIKLYPYEPSYYNFLVGGVKNVAEKGLFDAEYWAAGVKEAMERIGWESGEKKVIYPCLLAHLAQFYQTPGMILTPEANGADYALVPNSVSFFAAANSFYQKNHQLVYTVKRAGAPMYYVYRYKDINGFQCGRETEIIE